MMCKLWIDDVREPPFGWVWCKTTHEALIKIELHMKVSSIDMISIDYDSGDTNNEFVGVLDKMEYWQHEGVYDFTNIPIHIHSQNPVGVANMRRIIERNGWTEVK